VRPDGCSTTILFNRRFEDDACTYTSCCLGCHHETGRVTGYHPGCIRYKDYQSAPNLLDANSYSYDPWPSENVRRFRWLCSQSASMIHLSLAGRLPYELCDIVARYCVREYAFELSKPVWARYASLDGVPCIVSLANEQSSADAVPIARSDSLIETIYVAEDHLGVREVHFAGPLGKARDHPNPGLWWRAIRVHGPELEGQTDVRYVNSLPVEICSCKYASRVPNCAARFAQSRAVRRVAACFGPRYLPEASSPYPRSLSYEDYLYMTARVDNVVHVRLCRDKTGSVITGLVFEYTDGHQDSVGRIRLDCLEEPAMIDISQKMWLRTFRCTEEYPQVVDAGFSPIANSGGNTGGEYLYIMWHGVLDWWVSLHQCKLHYIGQTSLSTRYSFIGR